MSQIGGKMSKFYGETDIVSTYLRIILSNFVATDFYSLFRKSIKKNCNINQSMFIRQQQPNGFSKDEGF